MSLPDLEDTRLEGASAAVGDLPEVVEELYRQTDTILASGGIEAVDDLAIQRLLTLSVKLYVAKRQQGHDLSPFSGESVTATDVVVTAMGMLKAVNLDVFELSLWRGWGHA